MAIERGKDSSLPPTSPAHVVVTNGTGNGAGLAPSNANYRLRLNPNQDHRADNYDDLGTEFTPLLFSSLERYLPPNLLDVSRDTKYKYMRDILRRYLTEGERTRKTTIIFIPNHDFGVIDFNSAFLCMGNVHLKTNNTLRTARTICICTRGIEDNWAEWERKN